MPAQLTPPSQVEAQSRAMFTRVLCGWAADLIALRQSGLIVPGHRPGSQVVTPRFRGRAHPTHAWAGPEAAGLLRWRPNAA